MSKQYGQTGIGNPLEHGVGGPVTRVGSGTPEGAITGSRGDIFRRTDGGAGTTIYAKETGDDTNTGWVAYGAPGGGGGGVSISAIDTIGFTNVRGKWEFDGDLTDDSGNGYDLTSSTTETYLTLDGKKGFYSRGATVVDAAGGPGSSALLELVGETTVHCLVYMNDSFHQAAAYLWSYQGSGESEEANHLYTVEIQTTGILRYFIEYSGGSNSQKDFEAGIPTGRWVLVTMTRDIAGTGIKFYFNGELVGSQTASQAPTAGSGASVKELRLTESLCYYGNIVVSEEEQNAATVLAVAQQVGVAA